LKKVGAGNLYLNGVNTYTGGTIVSNGGLGGLGTINGTVLVTSGGTLVPGASVGTLTVNGTVTLQGGTHMELSRDSGTAAGDLLIATTLNRGGSLTISNSGITYLRSGDSFDLFNWTTVSGSFAPVTTPPLLPGLSWNTSNLFVDGTISISGTVIPPQFNPPDVSGGNVNLSGTGGVAGGFYYVLTSTDVALPASSWTSISTNVFDGSGNFSFSDTFDPDTPQRFYLIAIP
jgi:autotransporter-associated beta strand protein